MTPGAYRRAAAAKIGYTLAESPLALASRLDWRGVCFVGLGKDAKSLDQELRDEYPLAEISEPAPSPDQGALAVLAFLTGRCRQLDFPLDLHGSAFQMLVWQALRSIPYGETRSYSDIAEGIGRPAAARAVASACATNPVALAVPCHRVVGKDGAASGYRWGIANKKTLLANERHRAAKKG
jgi:AraC family transcriptional regulator of adaptative response/methylated-DNA-[protein]-cysteine methyltransferase